MLKKTKIVCTLGPSSNTPEIIEKMIKAGMNVARFNFSHGSHEEHKQRIDMVRAASQKLGIPVALLLDTKGPEIRLGKFKNGSIMMEAGKDFTLTARDIEIAGGALSPLSIELLGKARQLADAKG